MKAGFKSASELREEAREEQRRVLEAARDFARDAATRFGASAVYLFGSRARDDWRRGSDADLMVVSSAWEGVSTIDRAIQLRELWRGPVGAECIGVTPAEFEEGRGRPGIVSMALEAGMLQLWPREVSVRESREQQVSARNARQRT